MEELNPKMEEGIAKLLNTIANKLVKPSFNKFLLQKAVLRSVKAYLN